MNASPTSQEIAALIARRDRAFRAIIREVGPPPTRRRVGVHQRFSDLAESITFQLLATKAATTIHTRVRELCGGDVSVDTVLALEVAQLRAVGLSFTKARAMIELAQFVSDGRVRVDRHGRMTDDEITRDVTKVRGIGPWTAQMYLIHTLARPDVWPTGDFGVRHGWSVTHDLDEMVSEGELRDAGARFEGVRSAVAWYCWQAVDGRTRSN